MGRDGKLGRGARGEGAEQGDKDAGLKIYLMIPWRRRLGCGKTSRNQCFCLRPAVTECVLTRRLVLPSVFFLFVLGTGQKLLAGRRKADLFFFFSWWCMHETCGNIFTAKQERRLSFDAPGCLQYMRDDESWPPL